MNGKNAHQQIDSLILMNELNSFSPSSTSVDISAPLSEDLKNRTIAKNLANTVGSIGPQPKNIGLNKEVFKVLEDMYTGGAISKQAAKMLLKGGMPIKSAKDQLYDLAKKYRIRPDSQKSQKKILSDIKAKNIESKEIMETQKLFKKYGLDYPDADANFDDITKMLNKLGLLTPKQTIYKK